MAVGPDIGTEAHQLVDEHEPALEDVLGNEGDTIGDSIQRDGHRLQVGGKTRVGQRDDVDGLRAYVAAHTEAVFERAHHRTDLHQLVERDLQVLSTRSVHADVTSGHCRGIGIRAGDYAVRNDVVMGGPQLIDADDLERRRADAADLGAHRDEHLAQVDDLRLARRVVYERGAFGHDRGHHDVLGRPDAREVQPDLRPRQLRRLGDQVAMRVVEPCTQPLEPLHVQIECARSDRVAAGQSHASSAGAGEQRAEHADRTPDPPYMFVVRFMTDGLRDADRNLRRVARHLGT